MPDSSVNVWSLYLLRCMDGTVYTGIATDVRRRIAEHDSGVRGAKYLRGRGPLSLLYERQVGDRSLATRLELLVKKLSRREKDDLELLSERVDALLQQLADRSPQESQ
jgi:putative endonuclease